LLKKNAKIYLAGHTGLVGRALYETLSRAGYSRIITRPHRGLDLTNQQETENFFEIERPEFVFLAAAKVGGIRANSAYQGDFIYQNIMIAANVIQASYKTGVKKLLNLGSSCIYPRDARQPLKEDCLLTGPLEATNEGYAVAKIGAIKLCRYYNEQYGTAFISVMPSNLYGPGDNYHFENSHVLPALLRKFYLGRLLEEGRWDALRRSFQVFDNTEKFARAREDTLKAELEKQGILPGRVAIWGTGRPRREFLYSHDLAEACLFLMENYSPADLGEIINIGTGKDLTIKELAELIIEITGYPGRLEFDPSKPDGTPQKRLDVSRLNKLGFKAQVELKEGISRVFETLQGAIEA
jgi:GDP-L-fucose synthase